MLIDLYELQYIATIFQQLFGSIHITYINSWSLNQFIRCQIWEKKSKKDGVLK